MATSQSEPGREWSQFVARSKDGRELRVRVHTLRADQLQHCAELLTNHFVKDATIGRHSGIHDNPEAVEECKQYMWLLLRKPAVHAHVYVADDAPRALLAASVVQRVARGDPDDIFQYKARTKEMQRYLSYLHHIMVRRFRPADLLDRYRVDCYYHDMGLVVHPDYRLLGIAKRDGDIRRLVSAAHGVPVSASWCTAAGSQRAFAAAGWQLLCDLPFQELGDQLGITFRDTPPTCTLLATRVDAVEK